MRRALIFGAAVFVVCLIAVTALKTKHVGSILPKVYAQGEEGCSLATLHDGYGFSGDGFVLGGPVPVPFAQAGVVTADGDGNISGSFTINVGGTTSSLNFIGTYTVAQNCTGSLIDTTNQAHFNFVIADHGRQVRAVQTDPYIVWTLTATRQ